MLHLLRCGGKLPNINTEALEGRNGSSGCCSILLDVYIYMEKLKGGVGYQLRLKLIYVIYAFGLGSFLANSTML